MSTTYSKADPDRLRDFAVEAARLMKDRRCEDVCLLDVRGLSQVCDYVLIGSGSSDRQMKSVADEIKDFGGEQGHSCFRAARDGDATWIVTDFVDLVVHLFEPSHRAYYDLEALWSDAPLVAWERDGTAPRRPDHERVLPTEMSDE